MSLLIQVNYSMLQNITDFYGLQIKFEL